MNPTHAIILAIVLIITLCMAMGYCLYSSCSRAITAEYASQLQAEEDARAASGARAADANANTADNGAAGRTQAAGGA
jgi:hypothetical protein